MGEREYLTNIKFLIVDDCAFMRSTIRRILTTLGVQEMCEAGDGAEALKIMQTWPADIILLDWEMAPFNGIEFTNMVRNSSDITNAFIPIIMITAHSEYWRISKARDVGITEFLVKPISVATLFSRIRNVIEHPRPFVNAPGFFGPDRRRCHKLTRQTERREHDPDQVLPDHIMNQDEINDYFNLHTPLSIEMPHYDEPNSSKISSPSKAPHTEPGK